MSQDQIMNGGSSVAGSDREPETDRARPSRRALMTGMAVGVTGLLADALLTAPAAGAEPASVLLGQDNPTPGLTAISNTDSSTATAALQCDDVGGGIGPALVASVTNAANLSPAIQASAAGGGPAIEASTSTVGPAVLATTTGAGPAISALTNAVNAAPALQVGDGGIGKGSAIVVDLSYTPNDSTAVLVNTGGGGYAIYAKCTLSTNSMAVIAALHQGLGPGMNIAIDNIANVQPAISATTNGTGPALQIGDGSGGLGGGMTATILGALNYSPPLTATTSGRGPAIRATVANPASGGPALEGNVNGVGPAVSAVTSGTGPGLSATITNSRSASSAVMGVTTGTGSGVAGSAVSAGGKGVSGAGAQGATGVTGGSDSGVGVHAASATGAALDVVGKVVFSRSGIAIVPARGARVKVDLAAVSAQSMVFATVQGASGSVGVANVVPASSSFTINLSAVAPSNLRVAWMVLD